MDQNTWQLQEAKNRLSQLIDEAMANGPQTITRRGQPVVVVLPVSAFKAHVARQGSLVDFLQQSPLSGSGLEIERDLDRGRDTDL